MQNLIDGIHRFQRNVFRTRQAFFESLANGQNPETLFITCSDSRVNPNLITQTEPGELFIMRNAGNIVPPYGSSHGGEAATIEYAVDVIGVRDIIVCGHSHCGAMTAVLEPESCRNLPAVTAWLSHAEATRRIIRDSYQHLDGDALLSVTVQENVLVQLENLETHPCVAARLRQQRLTLHAWVYKIETGQVFTYSPDKGQFVASDGESPGTGLSPLQAGHSI
ncbi:MAG: carbonic anhydrase [Planctomycetes bacterium]|nr:carbonic anhydrase [Planctomycetota bacterium]